MTFRKSAALCAAAVICFVATGAEAKRNTRTYTSLTVFGDSLVDAGNYLADPTTNVNEPTAARGYFQGRWTNGYDYTDLLSIDLYGTPTQASYLGGQNYAYGGARILDTTPAVPNLPDQYASFQSRNPAIDGNGLYVLNFGANDIFNATTVVNSGQYPSGDALIQAAATNYAQFVQTLNDLGVRNILITDFPVAGALATSGNAYLTTALAGLKLNADTTVFRFNYIDAFTKIQTNPASYGLPPFTQTGTCQSGGAAAIAGGCVGYSTFDGTHPTAAVQNALYQEMNRQFALNASVPEPATWTMLIVGVGGIGFAMRRRGRVSTTVSFA